jgi:aspartate/methionine/tyrosine aminotransferase
MRAEVQQHPGPGLFPPAVAHQRSEAVEVAFVLHDLAQMAALEAVSGDLSAVAMMREAFARRAITMHRMLNDIPGVAAIEPQGAFYCYPNVKDLLGRPLGPNGTVSNSTLELADAILGSVSQNLIHHAECPVLVVR